MVIKAVLGSQHAGYTPLSAVGIGFGEPIFCDNDNRTKLRGMDGKTESGNATAYDQKIAFVSHESLSTHRLLRAVPNALCTVWWRLQ
jgi:hypothetical protein